MKDLLNLILASTFAALLIGALILFGLYAITRQLDDLKSPVHTESFLDEEVY